MDALETTFRRAADSWRHHNLDRDDQASRPDRALHAHDRPVARDVDRTDPLYDWRAGQTLVDELRDVVERYLTRHTGAAHATLAAAHAAIGNLAAMVDSFLDQLEAPRDVGAVIAMLGATGDPRVLSACAAALARMADQLVVSNRPPR